MLVKHICWLKYKHGRFGGVLSLYRALVTPLSGIKLVGASMAMRQLIYQLVVVMLVMVLVTVMALER